MYIYIYMCMYVYIYIYISITTNHPQAAKKQTSTEMSLLPADPEWQTALAGRSFPADTEDLLDIYIYVYIIYVMEYV